MLTTDWCFHGCNQEGQALATAHWQQIQHALDGRLRNLSDSSFRLQLALCHNDHSPAWEALAALRVRPAAVVAQTQGSSVTEVLDGILQQLIESVPPNKTASAQKSDNRIDPQSIQWLLERAHVSGHGEPFFFFLQPVIRQLRRYAARELRIRRVEGRLATRPTTLDDIMDEVLVRAWDQFRQYPKNLRLDLWVLQLIDQVLDQASVPLAQQSLAEVEPFSNEELEDDAVQEALAEALRDEDGSELAELLPGHPGVAVWDSLDMETKQWHLAELLSRLSREQRQALLLNAVEGFDVAQIADFQARSPNDVSEDIATATLALRQQFDAERLADEDLERPGGRDRLARKRRYDG